MNAYLVMDGDTGTELFGQPSAELVMVSLRDDLVPASLDGNVWQYVPPSTVSDARSRGDKVRTVYVQRVWP